MHRTLPYISLFVVTVLLQVFLFDNLSISIYLNPLVYVAFVALLPLDTPPVVLLASGLAMGVTMDLGFLPAVGQQSGIFLPGEDRVERTLDYDHLGLLEFGDDLRSV